MRIRILTFASIAVTGMGMTLVLTPAHAVRKPHHRVFDVPDANAQTACHGGWSEALPARPAQST